MSRQIIKRRGLGETEDPLWNWNWGEPTQPQSGNQNQDYRISDYEYWLGATGDPLLAAELAFGQQARTAYNEPAEFYDDRFNPYWTWNPTIQRAGQQQQAPPQTNAPPKNSKKQGFPMEYLLYGFLGVAIVVVMMQSRKR